MKIKTKLIVAILASGAVPLSGLWYYQYTNSVTTAKQKAEQNLIQTADNVSTSVNSWIEMNKRMMLGLAGTEAAKNNDPLAFGQIVETFNKNYPWQKIIFGADIEGNQYVRSDRKPGVYFGDKPAFIKVKNKNADFALAAVISADFGVPSILMTAPVKDDYGNFLGAVGARTELNVASNIVTKIANQRSDSTGETYFAFMTTANGDVLAHPTLGIDIKADKSATSLVSMKDTNEFKAVSNAKNGLFYFTLNGKEMIGATSKTSNEWIVGVAQPVEEVYQAQKETAKTSAIFLASSLLLLLAAALLVGRAISRPIIKLTGMAEQMSRGEFKDAEINKIASNNDEIGKLAEAINRMGNSIKAAMKMLKK